MTRKPRRWGKGEGNRRKNTQLSQEETWEYKRNTTGGNIKRGNKRE